MIESISILNFRNETVGVRLRSPDSSGFFIQSIDGLGPPKANINTMPTTGDGAIFNFARAEARNIVFQLGFFAVGNQSVEELRHKSYRMFPLKTAVRIEVKTDERTLYTTGYVESNEPVIFSRQSLTQISVLCMDPWMYDAEEEYIITESSKTIPAFEFPFSDDDSPSIEFSENNSSWRWVLVNNVGDKPVGALFQMEFGADAENPIIWETTLDGVTFLGPMFTQPLTDIVGTASPIAGDIMTFSTLKGDKYATLLRDGTTYDVFPKLIKTSNLRWFELQPGLNLFRFGSNTGLDELTARVLFTPAYEGV